MYRLLAQIGLVLFACLFASTAGAQMSGQVAAFTDLPQRVNLNPALRPSSNVNVGIPFLSNVYVEQSNNWFRPSRHLSIDDQGSAEIRAESLINDIGREAFTGFGVSLELAHVALGFGDHYFHFRMAERVQGAMAIPVDALALATYGNIGNYAYEDHTANLSGLRADVMHFREYALGYSMRISEELSVGLTAKYLYGMEAFRTAQSSLKLRTDPLSYEMRSSGALLFNTSGLGLGEEGENVRDNAGRYLTGLSNHGLAFDLGVSYRPIDALEISFAANDIGFIHWRQDVANFGTESADFAFSGIDFTEFIFLQGGDYDTALEAEIDAIAAEAEEAFGFESSHESFRSSMFSFLNYGASYQVIPSERFAGSAWVHVMHAVGHRNLPTRLSLGYRQNVSKILQVGLHYSKQSNDLGFVGGGFTLNASFFQLFFMMENANIFRWSRYQQMGTEAEGQQSKHSAYVVPRNASDVRIHFGMNLTFGRSKSLPGGNRRR